MMSPCDHTPNPLRFIDIVRYNRATLSDDSSHSSKIVNFTAKKLQYKLHGRINVTTFLNTEIEAVYISHVCRRTGWLRVVAWSVACPFHIQATQRLILTSSTFFRGYFPSSADSTRDRLSKEWALHTGKLPPEACSKTMWLSN